MLSFGALGQFALGQWQASNLTYGLAADAGSFVVTGQAARLLVAYKLPASVGAFSLTGVSTTTFAASMPAAAGEFTLTGVAASLRTARRLVASPYPLVDDGFFGFAALGAGPLGGLHTRLDDVTFRVNGPVTRLQVALLFGTGVFVVTGKPATLTLPRAIASSAGVFTLTGVAARLAVQHRLVCATGVFTTTGQVIDFARRGKKIRGFQRAGGSAVAARSVGRDLRARAHGG